VTPAYVPGRPGTGRLLLRQTCTTKAILDEPEWGSTTVLESWPLGANLSQKPIYIIKATGPGGRTVDGGLFVIERGTGEVEWCIANPQMGHNGSDEIEDQPNSRQDPCWGRPDSNR